MQLAQPQPYPTDLVELVKKRLKFTDEELAITDSSLLKITQIKTYKKHFQLFKPFFWIMLKMNRVPKSS